MVVCDMDICRPAQDVDIPEYPGKRPHVLHTHDHSGLCVEDFQAVVVGTGNEGCLCCKHVGTLRNLLFGLRTVLDSTH